MTAYRLTPRARQGIQGILEYVEERFGPGVAEQVLDHLIEAFEILAERPQLGHARADLTEDDRVRFWGVGPTLIAYRVLGDELQVLFVERASRDWPNLLREGPDEP